MLLVTLTARAPHNTACMCSMKKERSCLAFQELHAQSGARNKTKSLFSHLYEITQTDMCVMLSQDNAPSNSEKLHNVMQTKTLILNEKELLHLFPAFLDFPPEYAP